MTISGDMSSLNTIYTLAVNNYSRFVKEIYLYLGATITFSSDKSPLIATFSGDFIVPTKDPIQAQNISGDFSVTTILLAATSVACRR